MTDIDELAARVDALEARLAPRAAAPPITVGELTDVPAPSSPIASAWAQEVTNRAVLRFANYAAMNAWAAADGAVAWDNETKLTWRRIAGAWRAINPLVSQNGFVLVGAGIAGSNVSLANFVVPAAPFARTVTVGLRLQVTGAAGNADQFVVTVTHVNGALASTVCLMNLCCAIPTTSAALAAGATATITFLISRLAGANPGTVASDARYNAADVTVYAA